MTSNPYKCTDHKLDIACMGCISTYIARHNRMLSFLQNLVEGHVNYEDTAHISWDAAELLKEIGKL
jgi:hypothetical protein